MDQQPEVQSYIQTEFFFYMLPCYYAILALSFRYSSIIKEPPQINAPNLPAEAAITCVESQSQTVPGLDLQQPPPSYSLKSKLCLMNCYMYLFMAIFTFIGTPDLFYACNHKKYAIVYLFGSISWFMAPIILKRQYQRKLSQSLWVHRVIWIFSAAFAITKMFEDYLLFFNFILNILFIINNTVLAAYAIYRPQDTDTFELIHNQEIPGFIKIFFEYIELNSWVRKIFMIKEKALKPMHNTPEGLESDEIDELDMKFLDQSFKITTQSRRQEINLLNTLPRRNIFIDKKLHYVKTANGAIKYQYFILTQIGKQRFQASRTYEEFQSLQRQMCQFFSETNFPKLSFPKIQKSEEQTNRSQTLETWLVEILKKPIFIIEPLLQFLNVSKQISTPFKTYFDYSFRSFCSRSFMLKQMKKKDEERRSLVGYFEEEERNTVKMESLIKQHLDYIVEIDEEISGANEYGFVMTCIRKDKKNERINWKIRKTTEQVMGLNQRIQEQCKVSVPFYYQMVTKLGSKNAMAKKKGFKDYLMRLLKQQRYYCPSLFQFIRFDPINVEIKMLGTRIQLTSQKRINQQKRNSHYFQEYETNDDIIQIIRVDRLSPNTYKFRIQRKGFVFVRFSTEFEDLRNQLKQIYQGVSYVPQIQFEDGSKKQIKQRGEVFLRALESLPKIHINQCYTDFYHNML